MVLFLIAIEPAPFQYPEALQTLHNNLILTSTFFSYAFL